MQGVNKVILIGNVGKDPDVRYLESGVAVTSFPLATTEVYKNKNGEKITSTEWHNIVLWRGLAEIAEKFIKKGTPIYVEGKLRTRAWEDKEGNKRYTTEVIGDNLQLLGSKSSSENKPVADTHDSKEPAQTFDELSTQPGSDDLPF